MRAGLAVPLLVAQTATSFDVVSIKPAGEPDPAGIPGTLLQNNRWTARQTRLRQIIQNAYQTDGFDMPDRVVGGPDWIDKDRFDIVATSATTPTRTELETMT